MDTSSDHITEDPLGVRKRRRSTEEMEDFGAVMVRPKFSIKDMHFI